MKAIQTKYLPATDRKGSRIKAFDLDGNFVTISYPHEIGREEQCHELAVKALLDKMGWKGKLVGGWIKGGMVFCFVETYPEGKTVYSTTFTYPPDLPLD